MRQQEEKEEEAGHVDGGRLHALTHTEPQELSSSTTHIHTGKLEETLAALLSATPVYSFTGAWKIMNACSEGRLCSVDVKHSAILLLVSPL